jgi:hypothetical protein
MRQWLRKHRRLLKWTLIIVAAVWLLNFLFFGFSVDDFFIKGRLESAKANWEASGIKSYRMVIDVSIPLVTLPVRYSMTVKDSAVMEASYKGLIDLRDLNYNPEKASFETVDPAWVSHYTMGSLFDFASKYLNSNPIGHTTLEFSPLPGSYIVRFSEDCYSAPPVFGPAIGDCGFSYKIQKFEPLAE